MTECRHGGEPVECLVEVFQNAVRRVEAVLADVIPDLLNIAERAAGDFKPVHARRRRRSAL